MFNQLIKNFNTSIEALPLLSSIQQQPNPKQPPPAVDPHQDL
jgi:hypothetical protein